MAEEEKPDPTETEEEATPEEQKSTQEEEKAGLLTRFLTPKWLAILLAISIAGHAAGFAYFKLASAWRASEPTLEVSLGEFRFEADPSERGQITSADFSLHIALLDQVEAAARAELHAKERRVRQAVEELTRRAHSGDFDDPLLVVFKDRLQEGINETLGLRVISEVIVTDLKLQRRGPVTETITETANHLPWAEKPSG